MIKNIRRYISLTLRPPLVSDNLNDTLKLNRFLANPILIILFILAIDILAIHLYNFCIGFFMDLSNIIRSAGDNIDISYTDYFFNRKDTPIINTVTKVIYLILLIADVKIFYDFRISFSEKAMNKGTSGTSRWTTVKEVIQQYKEVEMFSSEYAVENIEEGDIEERINLETGEVTLHSRLIDGNGNRILKIKYDAYGKPKEKTVRSYTNWIDGKGGIPVLRWRDKLYIDSKLTNNLFLGTTRSGKGELYVFTLIDLYSRARKQIDRPSMIIFDPKLEIYKSASQVLIDRGYKVRLLNLDNPLKSAGYNPLEIVKEYYKKGKINEAQQLAKAFSFSIFNSSDDMQEPIWKNTATDLFTALILSVVSDCIAEDEALNNLRIQRFLDLRKIYDEADDEEKAIRKEAFTDEFIKVEKVRDNSLIKILGDDENFESYNYLSEREIGIPPYIEIDGIKIEFKDIPFIYPNEKKINCFSVINFFQTLVNVHSENAEVKAGAEKAEVALDDYFNARPSLDYAKALYASIKSAGDRTKGSIYVNMQSALTIFTQDNIARLTAESDIDISSLGFDKESPTAVFIGLPTEDKSNHFIANNFVNQTFQYLWKLAKEGNQKLYRELVYILDEFGNMPILDNFDGMVTNSLGAGIAFNIFIQSYNQLHSKYEVDEDTIKDNFANQIYIMTMGNESANEFSEQLGNKTVIDWQRSGLQFSRQKSILENNKERPLLFPAELKVLREGEVALVRAAKRTDNAGAGIRSYPIFAEYQDNIYFHNKVHCLFECINKRIFKKDLRINPDTKMPLSFMSELRYIISEKKRWFGTAFFYRYQHMSLDFPNPTDIIFNDIFKEKGREDIDYQNRTMNFQKVLGKLGLSFDAEREISPMKKKFYELPEITRNKFELIAKKELGYEYREYAHINQNMTAERVIDGIKEYIKSLPNEKQEELKRESFIGILQKTINL